LEFSFDRSKEANSRRPENNIQEAASGPRPGPDLNSVDPSTIANERLRKAIERNRAKQAERDAQRPAQAAAAPVGNFTQAQAEQYHQQNSFFSSQAAQSQPQAQMHEEIPVQREMPQAPPMMPARESMREREARDTSIPPRDVPRASIRSRMSARSAAAAPATSEEEVVPQATTVVSRRSVAKPEDTEFVPVKRTPRKVASQISYTTNSTRKKSKPVDPKYLTWLVKGSWIFCGLMVLRLIFAAGGVTDYYSQKSSVNDRISELNGIKKENMQLVREIERMRSDIGFQKRLVRDNLGFIAADEFLVLFPKD
jgi:cell division protein FtsB